ncbi:MAG: MBL fold metallo-hydrolase [Bacteroidota bacterium]
MRTVKAFTFEEIELYQFGVHSFKRPTLFAGVFFVDGLLIDTGQRKMQKEVLAQLQELKVEQIFITHYHEDHTGNVALLKEHFDCPVYGSALCQEIMRKPPAISPAQHLVWGDRPPFDGITPIESTLKTPNFHFDLIPIPGHAPDMLALHEPTRGWLFSADLFLNSYISYFIDYESMATGIISIRNVLQLDFGALLCSHNPKLQDGKKKLQQKLQFLEDFFGKVAIEYRKGQNAQQIFKTLQLKEDWFIRITSLGSLSKLNMVRSVIRDLENGSTV